MSCLFFSPETHYVPITHDQSESKLTHDLMSCPTSIIATLLDEIPAAHGSTVLSDPLKEVWFPVNCTRPNVVSKSGKHGLVFFTATVPFPRRQKTTSNEIDRKLPPFLDFAPKCFKNPLFPDFLPPKTQKTRKKQIPYCFSFKNNETVPKNLVKPLQNNPKVQIRKKMREMSRILP